MSTHTSADEAKTFPDEAILRTARKAYTPKRTLALLTTAIIMHSTTATTLTSPKVVDITTHTVRHTFDENKQQKSSKNNFPTLSLSTTPYQQSVPPPPTHLAAPPVPEASSNVINIHPITSTAYTRPSRRAPRTPSHTEGSPSVEVEPPEHIESSHITPTLSTSIHTPAGGEIIIHTHWSHIPTPDRTAAHANTQPRGPKPPPGGTTHSIYIPNRCGTAKCHISSPTPLPEMPPPEIIIHSHRSNISTPECTAAHANTQPRGPMPPPGGTTHSIHIHNRCGTAKCHISLPTPSPEVPPPDSNYPSITQPYQPQTANGSDVDISYLEPPHEAKHLPPISPPHHNQCIAPTDQHSPKQSIQTLHIESDITAAPLAWTAFDVPRCNPALSLCQGRTYGSRSDPWCDQASPKNSRGG